MLRCWFNAQVLVQEIENDKWKIMENDKWKMTNDKWQIMANDK